MFLTVFVTHVPEHLLKLESCPQTFCANYNIIAFSAEEIKTNKVNRPNEISFET